MKSKKIEAEMQCDGAEACPPNWCPHRKKHKRISDCGCLCRVIPGNHKCVEVKA